MHRNDAIYQTHYGGFLQAFHCRLKQKRIMGEPVKKNQLHEKFLYIVDRAHHHVRMKKYLEGRLPSDFLPLEGESCHKFVLRQDKRYLWWCNNWNNSIDGPTIASNLFMKHMEWYRCCDHGVERGNTWLMNIEGRHWSCGWKFVGKQKYAAEACFCVDTLKGKELTLEELE
jgi:hypothetical protein